MKNYIIKNNTKFVSIEEPYINDLSVSRGYSRCTSNYKHHVDAYAKQDSDNILKFILQYTNYNNFIVDCGVYMGSFCITAHLVSRNLKLAPKIYAYEASKLLEQPIRHNIELYGAEVTLSMTGVGEKSEERNLISSQSSMIGASLIHPKSGNTIKQQVPVVPLVSIIPGTFGIIKLDIEGNEICAFKSLFGKDDAFNNIYIIEINKWQLDQRIGDSTYAEFLFLHFHILTIGHWDFTRNVVPVKSLAEFRNIFNEQKRKVRGSVVDILALPKNFEIDFNNLISKLLNL